MKKILIFLTSGILAIGNSHAAKVAVTDLTYSEEVEGYIHIVDYHNKSSVSASASSAAVVSPYAAGASSQARLNANSKTDYFEYEQNYSYVEYGELRRFSGDIKGEILKSRNFQVVQAKPVTNIKTEKIYDIIARIKKGYYPGADYVLFGTVSEIHFSDDSYTPQDGGRMVAETFNLTITAEFSLISTKNYEVIASFSAVGDGADTKIQSNGTHAMPNRARVVADASKALGKDVAKQLDEQIHSHLDSAEDNSDYIQREIDVQSTSVGKGVTVFH